MKVVSHPNIIKLLYYWHELPSSSSPSSEEMYLNLVLEYMPETIYHTYR